MKNKIKVPITKGVAKVPFIMQLESTECGAACLGMILAYYNKWLPLEKVREDCGVSRDGSSAINIVKAARMYGFEALGYKYELEDIKANGIYPCIIHWNFNHFIVLNGFKNGKAYVNDPARGSYTLSMEEFDEGFTGVCLIFKPTEDFVPSGKPKSMNEFISRRLKGSKKAIIFTALITVIISIITFIKPAFNRIFLDYLLEGNNSSWLTPFLIFLGIFNLLEIIMVALRSIYYLRISGKVAATSSASYMWKVLNLPMRFFAQRRAGDIKNRQIANIDIANSLINIFAPLVINMILVIFYLLVMFRYSIILTIIGLFSLLLNGIVSKIISKKRVNLARIEIAERSKLSSETISGIEMIETIKASGSESGFFKKWSGYLASANSKAVKTIRLNSYLGMVPQLISILTNYVILILGVYLIIQGKFTVGMVMTFQGFLTSLMAPAETIIASGQALQEMRTQMERVDDVMKYPTEVIFKEDDEDENNKLSGAILLKDVSFGYSPLGNPLVKDFNMEIEPGKSVAIVGASGSGKSTMSKLISGLYKEWSGEILFDGKPISDISKSVFRGSVAVVDQDIILFEDTIANNVKMWDNTIEDFEMILACRDAKIHDSIINRPNGYNHKLIEGGKDFSGGERQRIEIARALAMDPSIIILDEATSALDAETEYEVFKAIKDRGITCIVIAHRLSTIRSCDEIIVMDQGKIVERGTHQELIESSQIYKNLVTSE